MDVSGRDVGYERSIPTIDSAILHRNKYEFELTEIESSFLTPAITFHFHLFGSHRYWYCVYSTKLSILTTLSQICKYEMSCVPGY